MMKASKYEDVEHVMKAGAPEAAKPSVKLGRRASALAISTFGVVYIATLLGKAGVALLGLLTP